MIQDNNFTQINNLENLNCSTLEMVLHKILHHLQIATNCDLSTIYLKNNDQLNFTILQNSSPFDEKIFNIQESMKNTKFQIDKNTKTILMQSFFKSEIIMINDIYKDNNFDFEFYYNFDKKFDYKTASILSVPLIDYHNQKTIGVLQLINKQNDSKSKVIPFDEKDKQLISFSIYLMTLSIISEQNNEKELFLHNTELEKKIEDRTQELLKTQVMLQEQAHKDPLTNLYNRRHFGEIQGSLFSMARRGNSPLSLLLIDIDNFKNINDSYGHNIGDLVIKSLSNIFINTIRQSDIAIRYGGEEFLILLTNTNTENSHIIAEKLRTQVKRTKIEIENNKHINFTISLGIAMVKKDDLNIETAIENADKALYKAKRTGKDKVVSYTETTT